MCSEHLTTQTPYDKAFVNRYPWHLLTQLMEPLLLNLYLDLVQGNSTLVFGASNLGVNPGIKTRTLR